MVLYAVAVDETAHSESTIRLSQLLRYNDREFKPCVGQPFCSKNLFRERLMFVSGFREVHLARKSGVAFTCYPVPSLTTVSGPLFPSTQRKPRA